MGRAAGEAESGLLRNVPRPRSQSSSPLQPALALMVRWVPGVRVCVGGAEGQRSELQRRVGGAPNPEKERGRRAFQSSRERSQRRAPVRQRGRGSGRGRRVPQREGAAKGAPGPRPGWAEGGREGRSPPPAAGAAPRPAATPSPASPAAPDSPPRADRAVSAQEDVRRVPDAPPAARRAPQPAAALEAHGPRLPR